MSAGLPSSLQPARSDRARAALPKDTEFLGGLGVADVLARDADIAAAVREHHPDGADAVLDLVSYAPGAFDAAVKDGGHVASPMGAAGDGPGRPTSRPSRAQRA